MDSKSLGSTNKLMFRTKHCHDVCNMCDLGWATQGIVHVKFPVSWVVHLAYLRIWAPPSVCTFVYHGPSLPIMAHAPLMAHGPCATSGPSWRAAWSQLSSKANNCPSRQRRSSRGRTRGLRTRIARRASGQTTVRAFALETKS